MFNLNDKQKQIIKNIYTCFILTLAVFGLVCYGINYFSPETWKEYFDSNGYWIKIMSFVGTIGAGGIWVIVKYFLGKATNNNLEQRIKTLLLESNIDVNSVKTVVKSAVEQRKQVSSARVPKKAKLLYTSVNGLKVYQNNMTLIFEWDAESYDFQTDFYKDFNNVAKEISEMIRKEEISENGNQDS